MSFPQKSVGKQAEIYRKTCSHKTACIPHPGSAVISGPNTSNYGTIISDEFSSTLAISAQNTTHNPSCQVAISFQSVISPPSYFCTPWSMHP
ncbi:hypothetical protein RSAG8_13731, partial [Rhizoctonia solani AG-8 WAC10335]